MSINDDGFDPNDPNNTCTPPDPCEPISTPDTGSGPGSDEGEGPQKSDESTETIPSVLFPWNRIIEPTSNAYRELTVIDRHAFSQLDPLTHEFTANIMDYSIEDYENILNSLVEETLGKRDRLRALLAKLWCHSAPSQDPNEPKKERFLDSFINQGVPTVRHDGTQVSRGYIYEVGGPDLGLAFNPEDELFDAQDNNWSSEITIFFPELYRHGYEDLEKIFLGKDAGIENGTSFPVPVEWTNERNASSLSQGVSETEFEDIVFTTPLPFYKKELDYMFSSQFNTVNIEPVVNFFKQEDQNKNEFYFKNIYRAYYDSKNDTNSEPGCKDKHLKFTSDSVQEMKNANESMKNNYNQYVQISINTQQGSPITTMMDEFQMDKYFLDMMSTAGTYKYVHIIDETLGASTEPSEYLTNINNRVEVSASTVVRDMPLYSEDSFSISKIKDMGINFFYAHPIDGRHLQYPLKYEFWDNSPMLRFSDIIRSQMFLNKVQGRFMKPEYVRSYRDILEGKRARSEIFGYRVAKHRIINDEEEPNPIQDFYVADSDKALTIDIVDTQVVPGRKYVYKIYALNFVFGSKYNYQNFSLGGEQIELNTMGETYPVKIPIVCKPCLKLVETPFFIKRVHLEEKPPLAPQVSFVPFRGVSDKMQILLSSDYGTKREVPIQILSTNSQVFENMRNTQEPSPDNTIEYQTDSIPKKYQIFRRSTPPETYLDFATSDYIKTMDTQYKTLLFVDEDFMPNKDYYYMFRSIDRVGISNPSFVYKVRMVNYENGIFMDLKEYEMRPLNNQQVDDMCFQRVLSCHPSFNQWSLVFPGSNIDTRDFALTAPSLDSTIIGSVPDEERMWGKNYKIRITSKSSGKKIDLNLKYELNKQEVNNPVIEDPADYVSQCPDIEQEQSREAPAPAPVQPSSPYEPALQTYEDIIADKDRALAGEEAAGSATKSDEQLARGDAATQAAARMYTGRETARYRLIEKGETLVQCKVRLTGQGYTNNTAKLICRFSTEDNPSTREPDAVETEDVGGGLRRVVDYDDGK